LTTRTDAQSRCSTPGGSARDPPSRPSPLRLPRPSPFDLPSRSVCTSNRHLELSGEAEVAMERLGPSSWRLAALKCVLFPLSPRSLPFCVDVPSFWQVDDSYRPLSNTRTRRKLADDCRELVECCRLVVVESPSVSPRLPSHSASAAPSAPSAIHIQRCLNSDESVGTGLQLLDSQNIALLAAFFLILGNDGWTAKVDPLSCLIEPLHHPATTRRLLTTRGWLRQRWRKTTDRRRKPRLDVSHPHLTRLRMVSTLIGTLGR
jgi:hypothetical protein